MFIADKRIKNQIDEIEGNMSLLIEKANGTSEIGEKYYSNLLNHITALTNSVQNEADNQDKQLTALQSILDYCSDDVKSEYSDEPIFNDEPPIFRGGTSISRF